MSEYLIVGGAGGVGSALVSALIGRGDVVTATVLNDDEAGLVAQAHGERVRTLRLDLGQADDIGPAIEAAFEAGACLDGVINCAAISPTGPVEGLDLGLFRKVLEVNLVANLAIAQATLPMLRANGGRVVFISSMAGRVAMPFIGAYSASKHGLEGLADVLRRELLTQGVGVILIEPGTIRTPMVDGQVRATEAAMASLAPEDEARYGHLYRGFANAAGEVGRNAALGVSAAQVADVIIEALSVETPQARYVVGEDAQQLIGAGSALDSPALDQTLFQAMSG